uniref:CDV3 homolog n=1 Tax=Coturnix japonica TaxID=93934 RepID=A0A8C2SV95_COTJA
MVSTEPAPDLTADISLGAGSCGTTQCHSLCDPALASSRPISSRAASSPHATHSRVATSASLPGGFGLAGGRFLLGRSLAEGLRRTRGSALPSPGSPAPCAWSRPWRSVPCQAAAAACGAVQCGAVRFHGRARPAAERSGPHLLARPPPLGAAPDPAAMAETEERSLDDFFAKRDKKKRKEKSGRSATAASTASSASSAASNATGAASAAGGPRPTDGGASGAAGSVSGSAKSKEEDDWKEFEQKEEIDYSGLRVQSMQISEKEDDESEKREEPSDNWEETSGAVDRSSGPWNKSAPAPAPVVETIVTEPPEPVQTGGVYRPPGAREGGRPRRAQQGPPEIYSDTQFPSLQSTAKLVDSRKDKEMEKSFEVVKHKTRDTEPS